MSELGYIRIYKLVACELNLTIEFLFICLAERGFLFKKYYQSTNLGGLPLKYIFLISFEDSADLTILNENSKMAKIVLS